MAYTPGYSGLLNAAFPRIGQYEASTGRRIRGQVVQGLLQADLDKSKKFAMQEDFRNRQLAIGQDQFNQQMAVQKQGQTAAGVGQVLQLPIAYGAAKSMGWVGGGAPAAGGGAPAAAGAGGAAGLTSSVAGGTAMSQVGAVGTTGGAQMAGAAYPGVGTGFTASPGAVGASSAVEGAGAVYGAGLLSSAGYGAAGSFAGRALGGPASKVLGTHEKSTRDAMGIGGGALAGFYAGGPVGAVIGGAIGAISSLF